MKKEVIHTDNAPKAIGPYSQAIKVDPIVYCSGQIPINPDTGEMANKIEEGTRQCLKNLQAVLESANSSLDQVVKVTVFLKNMDDFSLMNSVYSEFFPHNSPARAAVEVSRLPKDAVIMIDAISVIN